MEQKTRRQIQGWITAIRPKTLPAAVCPILPAAALAWAENMFHFPSVFIALIISVLLQVAVNVANDYFDFVHGIDTPDRIGPPRAAASGLLSLGALRTGMAVLTAVILAAGSYLIYRGGFPILFIGLTSIASVYLYSAGPLPFSTNGLGDLFVFIFYGPAAVCGTYFLQAGELSLEAAVLSIPIGFLITSIIVVNNYRDIGTDSKTGKKTLAVILGEKMTRIEYIVLVTASYMVPFIMVIFLRSSFWFLFPVTSFFLWIPLFKDMFRPASGVNLNSTLAGTAKLTLLFSILLSIGILLS